MLARSLKFSLGRNDPLDPTSLERLDLILNLLRSGRNNI